MDNFKHVHYYTTIDRIFNNIMANNIVIKMRKRKTHLLFIHLFILKTVLQTYRLSNLPPLTNII